jgi:hypothetical protein
MAIIKKVKNNKCWQGWDGRNPYKLLVGMLSSPGFGTNMEVSQKTENRTIIQLYHT